MLINSLTAIPDKIRAEGSEVKPPLFMTRDVFYIQLIKQEKSVTKHTYVSTIWCTGREIHALNMWICTLKIKESLDLPTIDTFGVKFSISLMFWWKRFQSRQRPINDQQNHERTWKTKKGAPKKKRGKISKFFCSCLNQNIKMLPQNGREC